MKIRILSSAPSGAADRHHLLSFVIEDRVAIDAGCLGIADSFSKSAGPTDVLLTHSHLDHLATLPLYLEDRHDLGNGPVRVHGPRAALAALKEHFFNGEVWVDDRAVRRGARPWVRLHALSPERPVRIGNLRVTAVPVSHPVPTFGYLVDDGVSAAVFGADSGATDRIWELARRNGRLRAAFLECSFPNSHEALARRTGHLTPRLLAAELAKLPPRARVFVVHIKPRFHERIVAELRAIGDPRLALVEAGRDIVV
jgi:ribonuclease BN (tRNA processing enzyme)